MSDPIPIRPTPQHRLHWLGLPVNPPVDCTLDDLFKSLPRFGRQPFVMPSLTNDEVGINPFLDMVYRLPSRQGAPCIPVGVVSKNYRLVDHHLLISTVQQALVDNNVDIDKVQVLGEWTVNGERARLSLILPPEERFNMRVAEGDEMRFRIEVFNSVDGSCRLSVVAGWLRFVCSNGLIIGTAVMQLRQQHRQQLQIEELSMLLREAIGFAEMDKQTIEDWLSMPLDSRVFRCWVDEEVKKLWGFKAAARIFQIATRGHDVKLVGDLKNRNPTEVETQKLDLVPGVCAPVEEMFGVSQVLSWVAGQRAEISENLEWRTQIPDLMAGLRGKMRG